MALGMRSVLEEWLRTALAATRAGESSDFANKRIEDEDWTAAQFAASLGLTLPVGDADMSHLNGTSSSSSSSSPLDGAVPQLSVLHLAAQGGHVAVIHELLEGGLGLDVDKQDQFGFSPLHYAVMSRNKQVVELLLSRGASPTLASLRGSTPTEVARRLGYTDIVAVLSAAESVVKNESVSRLADWLRALGAEEYFPGFVRAGYDIDFIAAEGLSGEDLDCVGVPITRLGLRRKIIARHNISDFLAVTPEDDESDESEEGEDADESAEEEN